MAAFPRYLAPLIAVLALLPEVSAKDEAIVSAPKWDCYVDGPRPEDSKLIWVSDVPGEGAGSLAVENRRILVGSTDLNKCTMNLFDPSGHLRWSAEHPFLRNRTHDYGGPLRCQARVDGDRAYYMSNRGEIVCVNFTNPRESNDAAPSQGEGGGPGDPTILWKVDMMKELGVFKRDAADPGNPLPSPLVLGDLVFCVTEHGVRADVPRADPDPPSFVALHKLTGKIAWSSNLPGAEIIFSQWASPVSARVNGADLVIFPGGDGLLYAFEPAAGRPLWAFDCNALGARDRFRQRIPPSRLVEARCGFLATPTVHGTMLFVALNENYAASQAHPLLALDLAGEDGEPKIVWQFSDPAFKGTYTSVAVDGGLVFVTGEDSLLFALDEKTGHECWRAKLETDQRTLFPSPAVYKGRLYAAGDSTISVFEVSREKKCLGQYIFSAEHLTTPAFEDDTMFVAGQKYLFALRLPE